MTNEEADDITFMCHNQIKGWTAPLAEDNYVTTTNSCICFCGYKWFIPCICYCGYKWFITKYSFLFDIVEMHNAPSEEGSIPKLLGD